MNNNQRFFKFLFVSTLIFSLSFSSYSQDKPLLNGHAHNDYKHDRPFHDAWEKGFNSIEVDVFLIKGELYVSHLKPIIKRKTNTLKSLYLEPLKEIVSKNQSVYPNSKQTFYLMIDIKTDANKTYKILKEQLSEYEFMLTKYEGDSKKEGAVTIFLSGNRPTEQILKEKEKFVAIDGRPNQLGKGYSSDFMPIVSAKFSDICDWNGKGEISSLQSEQLVYFVNDIHDEGKKARLWAIPDNEYAWSALLDAGIDLINTDKIEEFSAFMKEQM